MTDKDVNVEVQVEEPINPEDLPEVSQEDAESQTHDVPEPPTEKDDE